MPDLVAEAGVRCSIESALPDRLASRGKPTESRFSRDWVESAASLHR